LVATSRKGLLVVIRACMDKSAGFEDR